MSKRKPDHDKLADFVESRTAASRPCRTCRSNVNGHCVAIGGAVEPWWTGCIRHRMTKPQTNKGD
jgi:hypothetical protein